MSEERPHGATTIHASKGGSGTKWLLGAAAAVVLVGGGYFAWKSTMPGENETQIALNDQYSSQPLRAGPLPSDQRAQNDATSDDVAAPASSATRSPSARRSTARAATVPEETIGITPVNATTEYDAEGVVVTAPRRPTWARVPSARRLATFYPERALERGREGEASLHCTVQERGALDCVRVEETPGFGPAALRVARSLRHTQQLADGRDATGTPVNLRVVFRMADEERRG